MAADVFDQLVALLSASKAKFRVIEHEAAPRADKPSPVPAAEPESDALVQYEMLVDVLFPVLRKLCRECLLLTAKLD